VKRTEKQNLSWVLHPENESLQSRWTRLYPGRIQAEKKEKKPTDKAIPWEGTGGKEREKANGQGYTLGGYRRKRKRKKSQQTRHKPWEGQRRRKETEKPKDKALPWVGEKWENTKGYKKRKPKDKAISCFAMSKKGQKMRLCV